MKCLCCGRALTLSPDPQIADPLQSLDKWLKDHYGVTLHRIAAHIRAMSASEAPGHTDLMVSPESLDEYLEKNPPPEDAVSIAALTPPADGRE